MRRRHSDSSQSKAKAKPKTTTDYGNRVYTTDFGSRHTWRNNWIGKKLPRQGSRFRTHFLVALGSSLFMIISQYGLAFDMTEASDISFDPSRIASQVVTGIGFIGAGTIILQKHVVRGLTTAAGLWVTSAIGLACGSGMYALASAATVFVLICLEILSVMLDRFGTRNMSLTFTAPDRQSISHTIGKLKKDRVRIYNYSIKEQHSPEGNKYKVSMEIKVKRTQYESKMAEFLNEYDGVSIESIE